MATANRIPLWSCDNKRELLCQCGYNVFHHLLGQCLHCPGDSHQDMSSQLSLNAWLSQRTESQSIWWKESSEILTLECTAQFSHIHSSSWWKEIHSHSILQQKLGQCYIPFYCLLSKIIETHSLVLSKFLNCEGIWNFFESKYYFKVCQHK